MMTGRESVTESRLISRNDMTPILLCLICKFWLSKKGLSPYVVTVTKKRYRDEVLEPLVRLLRKAVGLE